MSLREAGQFFGWKNDGVIKKAADFTKEELIAKGFTKEVLEQMAEIYESIAKLTSDRTGLTNNNAPIRAKQLREILKRLF